MKLRSLHLQNYRKHVDTSIEFPDGIAAIVGQNGSGKSTILEAIGFALFGVHATRTGKDLLRNDDAAPGDPVSVELQFTLGDSVQIRRELKGKNLTPSAQLHVNGNAIVAPGSGSDGAATKEMERLLGMDRESFFTTVVAQQKELNKLAEIGSAERKKMLLRMLGVDAVTKAIAAARQERSKAESKLEGLRAMAMDAGEAKKRVEEAKEQAKQANQRLETANAVAVKAKAEWESLEKQVDQLHKQQQAHLDAKKRLDIAKQQVQQIGENVRAATEAWNEAKMAAHQAQKLASAEQELRQWQQVKDDAQAARMLLEKKEALEKQIVSLQPPRPFDETFLDAAKEALAATEETAATARSEGMLWKQKVKDLQEQLQDLETIGAECPTCKRPMEDHGPALQATLAASLAEAVDGLTEAEALLQRVTVERKQAKTEVAALEKQAQDAAIAASNYAVASKRQEEIQTELAPIKVPEIKPFEAELKRAEKAHREWVSWHTKAEGLQEKEQRAQTLQDSLGAARKEEDAAATAQQPDCLAALETAKMSLQQAKQTAQEANTNASESAADARVAASQVEHATAAWKIAQENQEKVHAQEEELRYWTALAGGRGRGLLEAFKTHLVGRIGPAIGQEAGRLLSKFTDGKYSEILLDAEYNITAAEHGIPYPLERFSGGEADLVHVALRLAVSRLLAERSGGVDLRFLALDEVFGSLDESRRDSVLGALHGLGGIYSQVLLITHHEGLKDALDATFLVEELDGVSTVTVQNG